MRNIVWTLLFFAIAAPSASGTASDKERREQAATRYIEVANMAAIWDSMVIEYAATLPNAEREVYLRSVQTEMNVRKVEQISTDVLVEVYTAEELEALARFYGSNVGQSILSKLGVFSAKLNESLVELMLEELDEAQ